MDIVKNAIHVQQLFWAQYTLAR